MGGPSPIFKATTELFLEISNHLKEEKSTPVIISSDGFHCTDIINEFVNNISPIPVIISNNQNVKAVSKLIKKPNQIFVFADTVTEIENGLKYSDVYTFWNVRAFMHFLVCYPLTDDRHWIESTMKLIWKNNILNFVFSYYYESLEIIGYNPFLREIINFTGYSRNPEKYLLMNKLHNMNGYQLKIVFFADPPRTVEKNGIYYGIDYMILKGFVDRLNASFKLIIPSTNETYEKFYFQYTDIVDGKSDFGFINCFVIKDIQRSVTTLYPRRMDDIVVIVPSGAVIPQFYYIFMVFGKTVWIFTITTFLFMLLYMFMVLRCFLKTNRDFSYLELLLEAYNATMLTSQIIINYKYAAIKVLILFWIFLCAVLDTLFRSLLTSNLITPKYEQNMETLEELIENNISITMNSFIFLGIKEQYPKRLIINKTDEEILSEITSGSTSSAYAIEMSIAELIASKMYKDGRPVYYILKDHLFPGYLTYLFAINSPYVDEANK